MFLPVLLKNLPINILQGLWHLSRDQCRFLPLVSPSEYLEAPVQHLV